MTEPIGFQTFSGPDNLSIHIFDAVVDGREYRAYSMDRHGLPPEKWSSLMYGLWPDGGLKNAKEETHGRRDRHEVAAG